MAGTLVPSDGGTSTAAAVLSSYLALAMQKWPDATGNQILQSLVRNTKEGKGKPTIDPERKRGFGEADLNALLTVDPTQYKDVNPILEYQMKAAAQYPEYKDWYTQDCSKNPDGIQPNGDLTDFEIPCEAGLIGKEYERQQAAWKKVEQCRADGGSDCMKYSATNTADAKGSGSVSGERSDAKPTAGLPVWAWGAIAGVGVVVVSAGIVLAIVLAKRRRRSQRPPRNVMPAATKRHAGPRERLSAGWTVSGPVFAGSGVSTGTGGSAGSRGSGTSLVCEAAYAAAARAEVSAGSRARSGAAAPAWSSFTVGRTRKRNEDPIR